MYLHFSVLVEVVVALPVPPSPSSRSFPGGMQVFWILISFDDADGLCFYSCYTYLLDMLQVCMIQQCDLVFVSRALLVVLTWVILLLRSSPKSNADPFGSFLANCLIRPSNLGLIMSLLNWLISLAACPRKASASIKGVRSSLLRSILYLPNLPITFSYDSVIACAAETFNNCILRRLILVIRRFGGFVRRF